MYGGDEYARSPEAPRQRQQMLPSIPQQRGGYNPHVKAPFATLTDLPPAGRRPRDSAAAPPGNAPYAMQMRWGSPKGLRAERFEKHPPFPSLAGHTAAGREPPPVSDGHRRARLQESKIREKRERFGWDFQGRADQGVLYAHKTQFNPRLPGQLPPLSLYHARMENAAHQAQRQRERGAPWE